MGIKSDFVWRKGGNTKGEVKVTNIEKARNQIKLSVG